MTEAANENSSPEITKCTPPCPFCGSRDLRTTDWCGDDGEFVAISCADCLAEAPAEIWNRRGRQTEADGDAFYLQDRRQHVGNDMLWWRKNGAGYTTNLAEAAVFTREAALRQANRRETDVPWPKSYIDAQARPAVDFQYVDREQALQADEVTA